MSLAVDSYRQVATLSDGAHQLNLAWTLDEREFLDCDSHALVKNCLRTEIEQHLPWSAQYLVKDPYGAQTLGPAFAQFFQCPALANNIACAAGVNALLQMLAPAWLDAKVALSPGLYPDFPHWLHANRANIISIAADAPLAQWQALLDEHQVSLIYLERPAFNGGAWDDLPTLQALCDSAAKRGTVVLIDESNANYCPPDYSAARLSTVLPNLVVLRGFAKAYGLGSIRVGVALASPGLIDQVRAMLAPLQTSSLSLFIARSVLEAGDVASRLRHRITAMKHKAHDLLAAAHIAVAPCSQYLPYLLLPDISRLSQPTPSGSILTKRHPLWVSGTQLDYIHRCSVPLNAERMQSFEQALTHIASTV